MLFATVIGLGCVEQTRGTVPADVLPGPSYSFINGPGSPGPMVVRVAGLPVFLVVNDPQRNLMSVHLDVSDNPICGAGGFDEFDVQRVSTPSVIEAFIAHRTADETSVAVYSTADFEEAGFLTTGFDPSIFCSFIVGPKKLAEGTARYERLAALPFEITDRWVGLLTGGDGTPIGYTDIQHGILDPSSGDFVRFTDNIVLAREPGR
jgi:hypothetical protein